MVGVEKTQGELCRLRDAHEEFEKEAGMTEPHIIDGRKHAGEIRLRAGGLARQLVETHGVQPGLTVVQVGDDPASSVYVRNKVNAAAEVGITSRRNQLPAQTARETLLGLVNEMNADPSVHGILVQLPLPDHLDASEVIQAISPEKDVDGFHPLNAGRLATGLPGFVPCTPLGCLALIRGSLPSLTGLHAVVVGRSNIVGKPMAHLLLAQNCTVTVAHSRTRDLQAVAAQADILVAAVGRPKLIQGEWIKPGATVIDVGINRVPGEGGKSRLVGDVDFASASKRAAAITPVPGGVGPMTVACLMANTVKAAFRQAGVEWRDDLVLGEVS